MIDLRLGDCLELMRDIPDKSIDLIFTSPPYFNTKEYSRWSSYADYLDFCKIFFSVIYFVIGEGCFFVLNTSPVIKARECRQKQSTRYGIPFDLHSIVMQIGGFDFIDDIIWEKPEGAAKNRNGGFNQHRKPMAYKPNSVTEYVMVYRRHTDKLIDWNIRNKADGVVSSSLIDGNYERSNVWHINPETNSDHPAPFPIGLAERVIRYYSFTGDVVLDPFMGSGTTGVACVKLGRNFIGMEISEQYFKVAERRIAEAQAQLTLDWGEKE